MRTEPPANLERDDASHLLGWAVEVLAHAVDVACDPVTVRQQVRTALEGRARLDVPALTRLLETTLEGARLSPAAVGEVAPSLETIELPLVTLSGGGLALLARHGQALEVLRPGQANPSRLPLAAARALVEGLPGPWLTAAPAAPLEPLGASAHPPHHHPSALQRLAALLRLERDDLWVIVVYAAAVGLFTLASPIAVQALVSTVAFGTLLQPIVVLAFLLLLALAFQGALRALQLRVVEALQQRFFARTTLDLAWRLPRVKPEAADDGYSPELVNRFFDVVTVQKAAHLLLTDGLATVLQIAIGLLVLAFYHPALLAFDLVLVALIGLLVWLPARRGLATSVAESEQKYQVAGWLEELARSGAAFRSKGGADFALERADALTRRYLTARQAHFRVAFGQTLGALALQVLASAALLGLGGWLVVQRELTLGQLVAAELLVAVVAAAMAKLGKLLDTAYDLLTALTKLGHLLDLPVEEPERGEPVPGQGGVRVEVRGAADEGEPRLTLEVPAGGRVAIAGAQGHRLGEWLAGLRLPHEGVIAFNSVETSRARSPRLREDVAFVRRGDLFDGTVLENVTVGRPSVTAGEARAALERVGLLDEVRALPQGLDTRVHASGVPLTPGQQTRLLLARALASAPRLLVVDESLEALEPLARARCVSALTHPAAPWTLVALVNERSAALARACPTQLTLASLERPAPPPAAAPVEDVS